MKLKLSARCPYLGSLVRSYTSLIDTIRTVMKPSLLSESEEASMAVEARRADGEKSGWLDGTLLRWRMIPDDSDAEVGDTVSICWRNIRSMLALAIAIIDVDYPLIRRHRYRYLISSLSSIIDRRSVGGGSTVRTRLWRYSWLCSVLYDSPNLNIQAYLPYILTTNMHRIRSDL